MGYSNRPAAITQVKIYLDEMLNTDEEIVWLSEDTDKLRYVIHQALNAAVMLAGRDSNYLPYARLKNKFQIRTEGNRVIAKPRRSTFTEAINYITQSRMPFKGIEDQAEIVEMLTKHNKAGELIFHFEGYKPALELSGLYEVAKSYGYYMIPSSTSLIFSKSEEDKSLAWTPEE